MIEAELALEVFVHPLGAPARLADARDLLAAHFASKRGEQEFGGFLFAVEPLGDEPERLALAELDAVVMGGLRAYEAEARTELAAGTFAQGEFSERLSTDGGITVAAVAHTKRKPGCWLRRV